jgi:hypothetical protein
VNEDGQHHADDDDEREDAPAHDLEAGLGAALPDPLILRILGRAQAQFMVVLLRCILEPPVGLDLILKSVRQGAGGRRERLKLLAD